MTDEVTLQTTVATPPAGTVIATDEAGGAHYQRIKLVDGTADSETVITGPYGAMDVSTKSVVLDLTMTMSTAVYASGDVLADSQELTGAVRASGLTGVLQSIIVVDQDDNAGALDIVVSGTGITLGTENSAVSISDADAAKILGIVEVAVGDYVDLTNSQVATKSNLGIPIEANGTSSIWVGTVSRDTKTYSASGIVLRVGILWD